MSELFSVFKAVKEDEQMVWSEVYAPMRPDSDGEYMDAEGVKEAAYGFMKAMKLDSVDSHHDNKLVPGCCVVESFIARKGDPDFIEGSWVIGMHIDNSEMWEKIKKQEINGFSLQALVNKDTVSVEMDIPPVVQGRTFKHEDDGHDHTFFVSYDKDGKFRGGHTDVASGHFHTIRKGSVTEEADGHLHRFSHLEDLVLVETTKE